MQRDARHPNPHKHPLLASAVGGSMMEDLKRLDEKRLQLYAGWLKHRLRWRNPMFDPKDFEENYLAFARLLGFQSVPPGVTHDDVATSSWRFFMDGRTYSGYPTEFLAAFEWARQTGHQQDIEDALHATDAGKPKDLREYLVDAQQVRKR